MSKYKWSLNLQLFAEDGDDDGFDDDFDSLPEDDFEIEADEPETETEEAEEPAEEPTIATEEEPPAPEPAFKLPVKYNKQDRELTLEEAQRYAQLGMNHDKAIAIARQEARDAWIAEQGHTWQGKPITTEAEYKQALAEQELQERYSDLPDELRQELIESRRDREERAKEKEEARKQAAQNAETDAFLDYFQRVNERPFDVSKDEIPQEVKDAIDRGETLKSAYQEWHNKTLLSQLKTMKQNEANSKKAPAGSVTKFGSNKTEPVDPFLAAFDEE